MGCACSRGRGGGRRSVRSSSSCQSTQSNWQSRSENSGIFDCGAYQMPDYEMPQRSMPRKPQRSAACCSNDTRIEVQPRADNCVEERCRCSSAGRRKSSRQQRRRRSCTTIHRSQRTTTYAQLVIPIRACPCADENDEDTRSCRSYND